MEWGSILQGIGGIAGGLGLGGKKGPSMSKQLRYQGHAFDQRMAKFKEHGIHPVYGLGAAPPGFSPTVSTGGGSDLGSIGDGAAAIAQGLKKPPKPSPTQTAMEDLGLREAQANVENSQLQNDLLRLEIARQARAANAEPTAPAPGGVPGFKNPTGKEVITIDAEGTQLDVTGMPTVENMEDRFDEFGTIEQAVRNLHTRMNRAAKPGTRAWMREQKMTPEQRREHRLKMNRERRADPFKWLRDLWEYSRRK